MYDGKKVNRFFQILNYLYMTFDLSLLKELLSFHVKISLFALDLCLPPSHSHGCMMIMFYDLCSNVHDDDQMSKKCFYCGTRNWF